MLDMLQFPPLHNHHSCLVPSHVYDEQFRHNNMAAAEAEGLPRRPISLYKQCVTAYVASLNYNVGTLERVNYLELLPPIVLADIYVTMSRCGKLENMLLGQLVSLDICARLLRFSSARQKMFHCIAILGRPLASQLENNYLLKYFPASTKRDKTTRKIEPIGSDVIDFGLRLSSFLSEAGWLLESINILSSIASSFDKSSQDQSTLIVQLDCLQRLLDSEAIYCSFKSAERTYSNILALMDKLTIERIPNNLLSNIYTRFSVLFFSRSEYDHSQKWSILALKQLKPTTPERIVIDVLRQAAKSCVVKREFKRAHMLINQAVKRARKTFGKRHQTYADALLDYGFFLLNVDYVSQSVDVYNDALKIKQFLFGQRNFHVAISHEDISYAYYVHEYSSGNFRQAREHVEDAIDIMKNLVQSDHLMLASAKRVKALLLEEIAIDKMGSNDGNDHHDLLNEAEELHQSALSLSLLAFGEINVQTAKHYGNLGRLYQSMTQFEEAEKMHKKAIKIKTDLLGPYDFEVGLSIGHLASLYNYHMHKYREAEELYLRSIEISLRLFGKTYSGLEYDYLGLCHIYESLNDVQKQLQYVRIMENWQLLRERENMNQRYVYPESWDDSTTLEEVTQKFFEMCSDTNTAESSTSSSSMTVSSSSLNAVLLQV